MKYRKKPIVIDAWQFLDPHAERPSWVETVLPHPDFGAVIEVRTLGVTMIALRGDWIIRGIKGEVYPCKDDIFQATYDAVSDETGDDDASDDVTMLQERLTRVVEGSKVLRAENATLWRVYDAGVALVAAHCTPGSPGQACIDFQDALAAVHADSAEAAKTSVEGDDYDDIFGEERFGGIEIVAAELVSRKEWTE